MEQLDPLFDNLRKWQSNKIQKVPGRREVEWIRWLPGERWTAGVLQSQSLHQEYAKDMFVLPANLSNCIRASAYSSFSGMGRLDFVERMQSTLRRWSTIEISRVRQRFRGRGNLRRRKANKRDMFSPRLRFRYKHLSCLKRVFIVFSVCF